MVEKLGVQRTPGANPEMYKSDDYSAHLKGENRTMEQREREEAGELPRFTHWSCSSWKYPVCADEVQYQYDMTICCAFVERKEHTEKGGDPAVQSVMGFKATWVRSLVCLFGVIIGIVKVCLQPCIIYLATHWQGPSPSGVLLVQLKLIVCASVFSMFCLVSVYAQTMYDLLCLVFPNCTS